MKSMMVTLQSHKKQLLYGLIGLVTVAGGIFYYQNSSSKGAEVKQQVAIAERRDVAAVVSATGTIAPVNTVDISSKITAQIKEVKVKENEQVIPGQVLVILEDTGLQAQVTQAQERLQNAAVKYNRTLRLNGIGGSSNEELDNSRMDYNIAQANYAEVMSDLNETVIASPIAGTVIGKPLSAGELVAQGVNNPTVIMTVADMSKMQIDANVDQTDIGKVALGQRVTFTVDAYPSKEFTGRVSVISRKPTVEQNVTYYKVTIDVDDAENKLNPGMVARVAVTISESKGALTVPLAAIRTDKTGKYVVVMSQNGQTQNVPVTTGNASDDRVEITSGLSDGDKVVVAQVKTQTQSGAQKTGNIRVPGTRGMF
ncbi:Macrolide export protein MacA [bioreactor metagenome]|uniref:Macrolide export protein MacA n=1 Tax=bioreactor metagenome TaxID=1076179 RepID=A0A644U7X4_9ZZZZ|nr:efflux RND transporter periplasmic adaptor subunit [Negativicutes bacterium]